MAEHLPWTYRPSEFDDWGWIRDARDCLAACAKGEQGDKLHDQHRTDGTDPYGEYAALIVKAVNNHDALVKMLEESAAYIRLNLEPCPSPQDDAILAAISAALAVLSSPQGGE